jgi:hypothetical protein
VAAIFLILGLSQSPLSFNCVALICIFWIFSILILPCLWPADTTPPTLMGCSISSTSRTLISTDMTATLILTVSEELNAARLFQVGLAGDFTGWRVNLLSSDRNQAVYELTKTIDGSEVFFPFSVQDYAGNVLFVLSTTDGSNLIVGAFV